MSRTARLHPIATHSLEQEPDFCPINTIEDLSKISLKEFKELQRLFFNEEQLQCKLALGEILAKQKYEKIIPELRKCLKTASLDASKLELLLLLARYQLKEVYFPLMQTRTQNYTKLVTGLKHLAVDERMDCSCFEPLSISKSVSNSMVEQMLESITS